jgi:hypothetical protein
MSLTMKNGERFKPKGFWYINAGHIIQLVGMVGICLAFLLTYDHLIRDTATTLSNHMIAESEFKKETKERIQVLENDRLIILPKLERIDEKLNGIIEAQRNHKK